MNMQGIGASGAGMMLTGGIKPHSDGLEPPLVQKQEQAQADRAQTNAAVSGVEATDTRRDSQSLDVYA